jgi:hypothetical protein
MRFPGLGFRVSARNSVNTSSHHSSRKCLSVGDVRASIAAAIVDDDYDTGCDFLAAAEITPGVLTASRERLPFHCVISAVV